MAYNKKNKVYAIKRAAFISICILCAIIIFYSAYKIYRNVVSKEAVNTSWASSNTSENKTIVIARAKFSMSQGELLDVSKAEMVEVPVELAPKGAITSFSKLDNMRLKREITEKEFLNDIDLRPKGTEYEDDDRLIEHNFAEGAVPAAVAAGSAIDIKLFIEGGVDSVVISKTVVISRSANLLSFYMDGREQEFIKEAATEGMLFAVQYIDDLQKASEVTYIPLYEKDRE